MCLCVSVCVGVCLCVSVCVGVCLSLVVGVQVICTSGYLSVLFYVLCPSVEQVFVLARIFVFYFLEN